MKKVNLPLLMLASFPAGMLAASTDDPVVAETAERYAQRMAWWKDAKFGMFVHWGVYSKAGGEWNGQTNHAEWLQLTAKIPLAEYTEYAKTFNPVRFNADQWVTRICPRVAMACDH